MFGVWKRRKRRRLMQLPLDERERRIVERHVPYCRYVSEDVRAELGGLIRVFLAEKRFEGCAGLEVTEAMRLAIAAQACILLLGRDTDVYPALFSVLVYPRAYVTREAVHDGDGFVREGPDERIGESWALGSVVLSWDDVERGGAADGVNVVFHEFAHQLDDENGAADGTPLLPSRAAVDAWVGVMTREYETHVEAADRGEPTLVDEYGAESPAEFFAVATESFFERAAELRERHPELYVQLAGFYRQDPAAILPPPPQVRRRVMRHPRPRSLR